jgi:hypothetical protein
MMYGVCTIENHDVAFFCSVNLCTSKPPHSYNHEISPISAHPAPFGCRDPIGTTEQARQWNRFGLPVVMNVCSAG